jgi:hypothetical protein
MYWECYPIIAGITREWLYWYDEAGRRYPAPNERVQLEAQRDRQEAQRATSRSSGQNNWHSDCENWVQVLLDFIPWVWRVRTVVDRSSSNIMVTWVDGWMD